MMILFMFATPNFKYTVKHKTILISTPVEGEYFLDQEFNQKIHDATGDKDRIINITTTPITRNGSTTNILITIIYSDDYGQMGK